MTRMDPRMAARRKAVQESHARRNLTRLFVLLGVVAVLAAVVWAFRSPMLALATFEVSGATRVDVPAVLNEAGVVEGMPLMDVDVDLARTQLEAEPWVESATVGRRWPNAIEIGVVERVPVGWVLTADGWAWVAADGVVVDSANEPQVGVPALVAPDRTSDSLAGDGAVIGMLEFMDALRPDLAGTAVIREVGSGFEAVIGGYQVRLGTGEQGRAKAAAVAAVIDRAPAAGSIITVMAPGQPAVLPPGALEGEVAPDDSTDNPEQG
ncbi:MAG: cell division protein FtsQ/DivIB [Acidimicrobiia bacterium]